VLVGLGRRQPPQIFMGCNKKRRLFKKISVVAQFIEQSGLRKSGNCKSYDKKKQTVLSMKGGQVEEDI